MNKLSPITIVLAVFGVAVAYFVLKYPLNIVNNGITPDTSPSITRVMPEPSNSGFPTYPDKPLASAPSSAMSVQYLNEHRSALNGKTVRVRGYVINSWADPSKCSPYAEMMCPRPVIFLADSNQPSSNPYYNLHVRLSEEDTSYSVGQKVEIKGIVSASGDSIQLIKIY